MPFIVTTTVVTAPIGSATTTVQSIVDAVSQDIRSQLATTGANAAILIDYTNRVSKRILRDQHHEFLLSAPQQFSTQLGITDYWIGANGTPSSGSYDTGLNLTDFGDISEESVLDRSNLTHLSRVRTQPNTPSFEFKDGSSRLGKPLEYKNLLTTPYVLSLYPAPDNQNTYQPTPLAPLVASTTSGALPARTYFVKQTFVDSSGGESLASSAARIYLPVNQVLQVRAPQPAISLSTSGIRYNKYRVYVGTVEGSETLQSVTTSTALDWTEPNSGLVAGAALPSANNIEPLRGYVMEFRYYKTRIPLTSSSQTLQIPDDYKDIVVAGVNALAFRFLKKYDEAAVCQRDFLDGLRQITRDRNNEPRYAQFIRPDVG